jgi:linoleoyl-CoA desaturase
MKTIQFIAKNKKEIEFSETLKRRVNEYFRSNNISLKGNFWMFLKAFILLATYIVSFLIALVFPIEPWLGILIAILMGIGEAGIGMSVMHDAAHGAFSKRKWVNSFFASTMFILGSNVLNWKIQHNLLHHTYTNIYGYDQDISTKAAIRLCDHAPLKKYHRFQFIYAFLLYGLMTISKLFSDLTQLLEFNRSGITKTQKRNGRKEIIVLILSKIVYFATLLVFPILFSSFSWWQVLIGFLLMHLTAGIIMSVIFQMAHVVEGTEQPLPDKNGIIYHDWLVHQLRSTADFAPKNAILNWYVGGLNFQIEHHLFSNICHIHYRKIAPIVQQTAIEFGIVYNVKPTFLKALKSHVNRLKELGGGKQKL